MANKPYFAHPSSNISDAAQIGPGTKIWQQCQIREETTLGASCILGKGVYIDARVKIGNQVKIQNGVSIYEGVTLEDGVFCGPHCVFTNDLHPRGINPDGSLKSPDDWEITPTLVRSGASIGANAAIVCGITIGHWAMIGTGAVVTHDVPDYGLVYGNPAQLFGFVCPCGHKLAWWPKRDMEEGPITMTCPECSAKVKIDRAAFRRWRDTV